ncbi:hypothetical protein [Catenulispora rubra]|uniref:hypothetical protein n=1 Tax=Catenulispora rubra TaxID=280293 RepID=UPI0018922012|nr:hypothetical protein [Catenulispora rubra]
MPALIRYYVALLLRSGRWLPATIFYAAIVSIGTQGSAKVGEALGYAGAGLVPSVAWLTRAALTAEPEAARHCVAGAVGPRRPHVAALAAATIVGFVLAAGGAAGMLAAVGSIHPTTALTAGLLTMALCVLAGSGVGALCNPPLLVRATWAIPIAGILAITVLVAAGSPVNAAIRGITPSDQAPRLPLLPAVLVIAATAVCWTVSTYVAARKEFHVGETD